MPTLKMMTALETMTEQGCTAPEVSATGMI